MCQLSMMNPLHILAQSVEMQQHSKRATLKKSTYSGQQLTIYKSRAGDRAAGYCAVSQLTNLKG